ncbi:MAG: hypothetical protein ACFFCS_22185 [Candidatus Hodarchaeota archaeon]
MRGKDFPRNIEAGPGTVKFMNFSKKWILFMGGMAICIHLTLEIASSIQAYLANYLHPITAMKIILESCFLIAIYIFGIFNLNNFWGNLSLVGAFYFLGDLTLEFIERPGYYTLAMFVWWSVISIGVVALVFALIRLLWIPILRGRKGFKFYKNFRRNIKPFHVFGIGFIAAIAGFVVIQEYNFDTLIGVPITVQPKDYQIEFRMWAH